GDLGYWVKFTYGKWTDGYFWRTPDQGYEDDEVNYNQETFSLGRKQLYYLNTVETSTHRAYFIKELREDAKSSDVQNLNYLYQNNSPSEFRVKSGQAPVEYIACDANGQPTNGGIPHTFSDGRYRENNKKFEFNLSSPAAVKPLKLSKIYLFEKETYAPQIPVGDSLITASKGNLEVIDQVEVQKRRVEIDIEEINGVFVPVKRIEWDSEGDFCNVVIPYKEFSLYFNDQVLDVNDVAAWETANGGVLLESNALQVIEFDQDYLLSPGMPNSDAITGGKLSLNTLTFKGKKGDALVPPYQFNYGAPIENMTYSNQPDPWGFYGPENDYEQKLDIDTWSLKEIISPNGGKTLINYESDAYHIETALGSNKANINTGAVEEFDTDSLYLIVSTDILNIALQNQANIEIEIKFRAVIDIVDQQGNPDEYITTGTSTRTIDAIDPVTSRIYLTGGKIEVGNAGTVTGASESIMKVDLNIAYGGGLRVSSLQTTDGIDTYTVKYDYDDPSTGITSGVTTFAPKEVDRFIPYVNEIPGSNVMYEYVTIHQEGDDGSIEGSIRYQFDVPQATLDPLEAEFTMGHHFEVEDITPGKELEYYVQPHNSEPQDGRDDFLYERVSVIHDRTSQIGRILSVSNFSSQGTELSRTDYTYATDAETDIGGAHSHTGRFQESFHNVKRITYDENPFFVNWHFTTSSRISYPNVLTKTTNRTGRMLTESEVADHDPYTGQPRITYTTDGYGQKLKSEVEFL
ncbi:MAG: hypothetical protein AAF388_25080, partial [Bacteroidota bacterium]